MTKAQAGIEKIDAQKNVSKFLNIIPEEDALYLGELVDSTKKILYGSGLKKSPVNLKFSSTIPLNSQWSILKKSIGNLNVKPMSGFSNFRLLTNLSFNRLLRVMTPEFFIIFNYYIS